MGTQPGDEFLKLVNANKGIIYKICNAYCRNKSDRDDLAQEIMYQLWKNNGRFDGNNAFTTWMYRVALNVAISFYRRQKQHPAPAPYTESLEAIEDSGNNSETEANIRLLWQFIGDLKELDKALMLLYLEAKSYAEIAQIIGITETNVATKISRIKDKLKQKFENNKN